MSIYNYDELIGGTNMKKMILNVLLIALYCFPFTYYAMYKDFSDASMVGYVFTIVLVTFNASLSALYGTKWAILIGNIISALVSYYFTANVTGPERWFGYFKPFQPTTLVIVVSILMLIPQMIAVFILKRKHRD